MLYWSGSIASGQDRPKDNVNKDKPTYGKVDAKLQARVDKGEVQVTAGGVSALVPQDALLIFNVYNAGTNTEYGFGISDDKKHELRIKCILMAFEQRRQVWVLVEKGEIIAVIVR